jgi:hypothetical protein
MSRSTVRMGMITLGLIALAYMLVSFMAEPLVQKRNRYLIPEGYVGWLCVTYKAPDAPVLEMEEGFRLIRFDESGEVRTATEAMPGKHWDEFYYYADEERRRINPRKHIGGGYTDESDKASGGYTFRFWISGDKQKDAELFSNDAGDACGPVAAATKPSQ